MEENIDLQRLRLEERRIEAEIEHKRMEIDLRVKELELQKTQNEDNKHKRGFFAQIFSPVGAAVIVGLIGLFGTAASGFINIYLENKKSQAELLVKMSDVDDEKQRARNLLFYSKGGYLTFSSDYEKYLRKLADLREDEEIPPPSSVPEDIKKLLPTGAINGLALSKFSHKVDLKKLNQDGSQFAFVRVSQGIDRKDEKASENIEAATAAGLKIGLYHFFVPQDDPDKQAENFLAELRSKRWDLPPMLDCEDFNGKIPANYANNLYKFATRIKLEVGYEPIIYTYMRFAEQHLDDRFKEFPVIIQSTDRGKKPAVPKWWDDFTFWHYDLGEENSQFQGIDRIVYNGSNETFLHLSEQLKVSPKSIQ
jgi:lysozyme